MNRIITLFVTSFFLLSCPVGLNEYEIKNEELISIEQRNDFGSIAFITYISFTKGSVVETKLAGGVAVYNTVIDNEPSGYSYISTYILTAAHFCVAVELSQFKDTSIFAAYEPDGTIHPVEMVDFNPLNELCLLRTIGSQWELTNNQIINPDSISPQSRIYNYSNPSGRYHGRNIIPNGNLPPALNEYSVTFRYDGYFAGLYSDIMFAHSIMTFVGQSGSPVLYNGRILGIISASDSRTSQIGFAVRGNIIYNYLTDMGIEVSYE